MKLIVNCGTGAIGSALCGRLVSERGDSMVNIGKLTYAANLRQLGSIADQFIS